MLTVACSDQTAVTGSPRFSDSDFSCSIPSSELLNGGPGKDGIPALTNPEFVESNAAGTEYLLDEDRVVGLVVDGAPLAIPLNIFWWHEIVNLNLGAIPLAITHCPLTGSSLGFDRTNAAGAEFGVSGLLFRNNLVMYDRANPESLWPQMLRGGRCGVRTGTALDMVPVIETNWVGWRTLYPDTRVVSSDTGFGRDYRVYPYGNYDNLNNSTVLFPLQVDRRRPAKERVLGIPMDPDGGVAFPFGELDALGPLAAVHLDVLGEPTVVFWDRGRQAAMAYSPSAGGQDLTFSFVGNNVVDDQTGSVWRVDGLAVNGPLAGARLEAIPEAFVAFWFAWPAFYPDIEIWTANGQRDDLQ